MGGVAGEAALAGKGIVDAGQHGVEGARQPAQLVVRQVEMEPRAEIAGADAAGERGDGGHGSEGAAGEDVAAGRGHEEHERAGEGEDRQELRQRFVDVVAVQGHLQRASRRLRSQRAARAR